MPFSVPFYTSIGLEHHLFGILRRLLVNRCQDMLLPNLVTARSLTIRGSQPNSLASDSVLGQMTYLNLILCVCNYLRCSNSRSYKSICALQYLVAHTAATNVPRIHRHCVDVISSIRSRNSDINIIHHQTMPRISRADKSGDLNGQEVYDIVKPALTCG
jgi:hypothetical protein